MPSQSMRGFAVRSSHKAQRRRYERYYPKGPFYNDNELSDFVRFTQNDPIDVRFIEYMPFDGNPWAENKFVSDATMLEPVARHYGRLERVPTETTDTTKYYRVPGFAGRVGFITSMTDHFCSGCNRIRVTADGNLKVCLFGNDEISLRDVMRAGGSDQDVETLIEQALWNKHFALGGEEGYVRYFAFRKQKHGPHWRIEAHIFHCH